MNVGNSKKWVLRVLLLLVVLGGVCYARIQVKGVWQYNREQYGRLEQLPQRLMHASLLQVELDEYERDVERLRRYIVASEELIEVVADIESEGIKYNIDVHVSDLQKELVLDEKSGKLVEPNGPLQDVRVHVTVSGSPEDIVAFLHGMEHLPYLLRVVSWKVGVDQAVGGGVFAGQAPGVDSEEALESTGYGEAEVLVTTKKGE